MCSVVEPLYHLIAMHHISMRTTVARDGMVWSIHNSTSVPSILQQLGAVQMRGLESMPKLHVQRYCAYKYDYVYHMYIYTHIFMCMYVYIDMYVPVCVYIHTHMYIYNHLKVYVRICVCNVCNVRSVCNVCNVCNQCVYI